MPPPSSKTDDELVSRLREFAQREDFEGGMYYLRREYGERVHRFIWRFFADPRDAEEVAQEVWLGVYQSLPKFEFRSAPQTWVFRIAKYKAIDLRRKHRSFVPLDSIVERQLVAGRVGKPSARPPQEADYSAAERRDRIATALQKLSERDRMVVLLKIQGELRSHEIADIVGEGMTADNARKIWNRILHRELTPAFEGSG